MGKLKLARHNEYMFQQVKCSHYMKRVKDGKFISHCSANESMSGRDEWYYEDLHNDKSQEIPDDEIGGSDFVKTYYERVAKDFVGIVVGFELLTATAELFYTPRPPINGYALTEKGYKSQAWQDACDEWCKSMEEWANGI